MVFTSKGINPESKNQNMKSTPFHQKSGPIEPKRVWYYRDQITNKNLSVIARNRIDSVRKALKKAKHSDLLFQMEGTP
jgi:hypothetical protein